MGCPSVNETCTSGTTLPTEVPAQERGDPSPGTLWQDSLWGKECCIPLWGVATAAGGGFVMLVLILVLSVCLCRARRRVKKLVAWKDGAELEDPDVHYASLQNLASAQVGEQEPEPPGPQHTDYATVAEVKGLAEEGGEGEAWPDRGADPGELVQDPQEGEAWPDRGRDPGELMQDPQEGEAWPDRGRDPGELVQDPQEGAAAH
ncbi:leukocyte-specific transcript 1 protein isoform X1 [Mauremys reevesii]|uniref:leukocyte-specific transcript 1 protein isoform X1 n=1 Tax=Mauremys reevesii TaxID=260615 RepID=UPI00193EF2A1|nr:leukocyte-specific transcript 1 protein isoform X1 [Mauremys reevesii]